MLLSEQQRLAGSVSGGCLEADLLGSAWERTSDGPVLVTYDASADEDIIWGFGLGCNGTVEVLLERISHAKECATKVLEGLENCIETREPLVLVSPLGGHELGRHWALGDPLLTPSYKSFAEQMLGTSATVIKDIGGARVLFEGILPPRRLIIFGTGHDVCAVIDAAKLLGWRVEVVDTKGRGTFDGFSKADVFTAIAAEDISTLGLGGNDAAVIMSHNYLADQAALAQLLDSPCGYIGLLGPRRRTDRILEELGRAHDGRLHSPIGLDIGAEGAEQIALAIVAEIQAFFAGKCGGHLREVGEPIHDRSGQEIASCNRSA